MEIINQIPVRLPRGEIRRQLHLDKDKRWEEVQTLIEEAKTLIRPKAAFKVSYISQKLESAVDIDGVRFSSRVLLRKNLEEVERVFPYVITIGDRLKEKGSESKDLIKEYYFDVVGNIALSATRKFVEKQLQSRYGLDGMSSMSPGSLTDWPIEEQKPLFSLFGEQETRGTRDSHWREIEQTSSYAAGKINIRNLFSHRGFIFQLPAVPAG
jgi:hypothetical protein